MTLKRTAIKPMSDRRREECKEAGIFPTSTIRPRANWQHLDRKPMKAGRPKLAVPKSTRKALRQRSEGVCEMQIPDLCAWFAVDPSHRDARGMGGRHGLAEVESARLSNVVDSCRPCHDHCHRNVAWAVGLGFFLESGQESTLTPLLYRGEVKYLDDLGGVHDFGQVGTA